MAKRVTSTDKIELVETQNLALALRRLNNVNEWGGGVTKRALYHAICMTLSFEATSRGKIREALSLP